MNTIVRRTPGMFFRRLLFRLGWTFRHRRDERDGWHHWSFTRTASEYPNQPTDKQQFHAFGGESRWFSKKCRRLCFEWEISESRRSLKFRWGVPLLFMHYLKFSWVLPCWFGKYLRGEYPNAIYYGFYVIRDSFHLAWAQDSMAWSRDGSTGWCYHFSFERLKERAQRITEQTFTENVAFTQPAWRYRPASEHVMVATYTDTRLHFRRPWNKDHHVYYVDISFNREQGATSPPKFSGKGENSWDCGDDGIFGCAVAIPEELGVRYAKAIAVESSLDATRMANKYRREILQIAVDGYLEKVKKSRERYG